MSGYSSTPRQVQGRQVATTPLKTIVLPLGQEVDLISFLDSADLSDGSNQTIEVVDQSAALAKSVVDTFDNGSIDPLWTINENSGHVRELAPGQVWLKAKALVLGIVGLEAFNDVFNTTFLYQALIGDFDVTCRMGVEGLFRSGVQTTDFDSGCFIVTINNDAPVQQNWFGGRLGRRGDLGGVLRRESLNTVNNVTTIAVSNAHVSSETDGGIDEIVYWRLSRAGDTFSLFYKLTAAAGWTAFDSQVRADLGATIRLGVTCVGGLSNSRPSHIVKLKTIGGSIVDSFSNPALPGWTTLNSDYCNVFNGTGGQLWILQDAWWDMARGTGINSPRAERSIAGTTWSVQAKAYYENQSAVLSPASDVGLIAKDPLSNSHVGIRWYAAGGLNFEANEDADVNHYLYLPEYTFTPTSPIYLRLDRIGNSFAGYYKQNVTDDWTLIGTAYVNFATTGFMPNPCNLVMFLTSEPSFTGVEPDEIPTTPFPLAKWDDMQFAVYPTTDKTALTSIVTPGAAVASVDSVVAVTALHGGTGSARIAYGVRGGGSPGLFTVPVVLFDGEVELLAVPLVGDYEWRVEVTLASATGVEQPLVDCILSKWTPA